MKIAVCDDNPSELQYICQLLEDYLTNNTEYPFSIHPFTCALSLLDFMKKHPVDFYILDVLMPGIDGIELGEAIREIDTEAPVVYITSSPDFAVKSYAVQASDYILKPVTTDTFFCLMERINKRYKDKNYKRWPIKVKSGFYSVPCNEIMYIEYQEHRLNCHLADGKVIKSNTLRISFDEAVAALKEDSRFLKIGASFLVNMNFVLKVTTKEFIMKDESCLTITRQYKDARKTYIDFLLTGGV